MPSKYENADDEVYDLLTSVIDEYFSVLAGLSPPLCFEVRMATNYKGPAVKHHGHACAAKIKLVKPDERAKAEGRADVRIYIDADLWRGFFSDKEKIALFHHELSHLVIVREKKTATILYDPYGRIRLKLKLDDWFLTGFLETSRLFGEAALEVQSLSSVQKKVRDYAKSSGGQLPFGGAEPPSTSRGKKSKKKGGGEDSAAPEESAA